jgi:predicted transposase/invertase (TIGR01784 family)
MLYSVNIEGKPGYLYMLCEMQTRPEKHMALRMLSYVVRILEKHVQQHPNEPLPAVYRIVYYQGRRSPYPYSQNIADLFGDLTLAEQTLIEPFQLIDLTCIEDEVLRSHKSAALMELVQKHIFSRDILPHLHEFIQLLDTVIKEGSGDYLTAVLNYIISKAEISDKQKALEMLQSALPEAQESIMNLAEHWKQEGMQQGVQQGMQQGVQLRNIEIAQNMLKMAVDNDVITQATGLSEEEISNLAEKTKN